MGLIKKSHGDLVNVKAEVVSISSDISALWFTINLLNGDEAVDELSYQCDVSESDNLEVSDIIKQHLIDSGEYEYR